MQRLPIILLALLLVAFRLLGAAFDDALPGFQPLPALLLCSLVLLDGRARWLLPLGVWLLTDPLVSLLQGQPLTGWHHLALPLGLAPTVLLAAPLRRNPRALPLLATSVLAAVAFYFLTNLVSFATLPLYPKTAAGLLQAEWTGPAGFGPTWVFLRNALGANLLFTALVLAARHGLPVARAGRALPAPNH